MARSVLKTRLRVTHSPALRRPARRIARRSLLLGPAAARVGLTALLLGAPSLAAAQTIEPFTFQAFTRDTEFRETTEKPYWINRDDCLANDVLHFDVKVISPTDDNFQVWVGSVDCTNHLQRIGEDARCWQVFEGTATSHSFEVDIEVRDIIARQAGRMSQGSIDVCDDEFEESLGIYFMYVNDSGDVRGRGAKWSETGVDIKGPLPPANVTAGIGDEMLVAKWSASDSLQFKSYNVYCAPAGVGAEPVLEIDGGATPDLVSGASSDSDGDAGPSDAGLDAGSREGGPVPAPTGETSSEATESTAASSADAGGESCWGEGLIAGRVPSVDLVPCGTVTSKTATQGYATKLTNGQRYALAVATVDELGNPGELSNVACGIPEPVQEFYEHYREEGGGGGGGICGVAAIGKTAGHITGSLGALTAGLTLGGALVLRRRAKRRRPGSERQS